MRTLPSVVVCLTLGLGCAAAAADAVEPAARLTQPIDAQPLTSALKVFAQQTGLQLVYVSEVVAGLQSRGADSGTSTEQALRQLLSGTGLTFEFLNERTVSVRGAKDKTAGRAGASSAWASSAATPVQLAAVDSNGGGSGADTTSDPKKPDAGPAEATGVQEIVVTAQKRQERLHDVPQSITVISADQLVHRGATQLRDFAESIPGMTFETEGAGNSHITMRGITTGFFTISPTVMVYVDEVPFGSTTQFGQGGRYTFDAAPFDMERIEVLRGPQGTLYGASAIGGLVKYVTKRPDSTRFGGDVSSGVSSTRHGGVGYDIAAAVNMPLAQDKAALRASAYQVHDGGYIDSVRTGEKDVNRSNVSGGRLDFLYTPTDRLSIRVTGLAQNTDRDGSGTADYDRVTHLPIKGSLLQNRMAERFYQTHRVIATEIDYDFGGATLTAASSYQEQALHSNIDYTGSFGPTLTSRGIPYDRIPLFEHTHTNKFVQEVRLASKPGKKIDWLIGAFYNDEKSNRNQYALTLDAQSVAGPPDIYGFDNPTTYEEMAAFGNLTWNISARLNVSVGLRYARNDQGIVQTNSGILNPASPIPSRSDDNVVTYLANARYSFDRSTSLYVRYATGYRPGGPNYGGVGLGGIAFFPPPFDNDSLKSYELGLRTETPGKLFATDLSVYYIDWSNVISTVVINGNSYIGNLTGGASVKGSELALTLRPSAGLVLGSSLALQDTKVLKAEPFLGAAKGEVLPGVAKYTADVEADYTFRNLAYRPSIGATLRYRDERKAAFGATAYVIPDYTAVDIRAGLNIGSINAQLYVRNLLDDRGQLSAYVSSGILKVAPIQPRTIGLQASYQF